MTALSLMGVERLKDSVTANGLSTIADYIRWAFSRFNEAELFYGHGTDNGWDEAVQLVLQSLHLPWDFDRSLMSCHLTETEQHLLQQQIDRRIDERIPLAYLINKAWFCGMPFYVDERVLVPRSPIAELIEQEFQPWLGDTRVSKVLDLCTGSGCIGIACAAAYPEAEVDLVDLSEEALQVATINVDNHELLGRVECIQSDLFCALADRQYDLIVSNPPYVDAEDLGDMPAEFHHEPELGLAAGNDGLDLAWRILAQAADYLSDQGLLVMEVGNSWVALQQQAPEVPFAWVEFAHGGDGVLALSADDCRKYQDQFKMLVS
ncbi:50S ribosomal protein L3 N(5)-glutamine methyltransferase [Aestuariirhabdus sp. Z084]|uniref:50S ribosomal protein L3 N(5)-glutamine methyltransferase n=1 Tax=Aestuariirhabdus haliotis TaxID=2918751 RepID=UPI00201B3A40|nr:50S ribosomal protein L3 N(5)-glutamine methyltransferase [Aestuariirhabdus haliotis]MCL6414531.1 50S ribosomal protein L3 N(5)-glutamine methyltransferase [Aestuariirhabdus haliotis]MCL6418487.1 50S ribosomal protein L3 N(5)-glutamine methyltransferase [Aestuariirhabdus haliotis]